MVYVYIILVLLLANLPFLTHIPWVFVPFRQEGEPLGNKPLLYLFRALLSYGIILFLLYYALTLHQAYLQLACLVGLLLMLSLPYMMVVRFGVRKSTVVRVVEVFVFYFISLSIGLYLESLRTNVAEKDWRFYVVTLCVFLVFSSIGFIFRVLMKKRSVARKKVGS